MMTSLGSYLLFLRSKYTTVHDIAQVYALITSRFYRLNSGREVTE